MDELRLTSRHIPSPADHPPEGQKRFRLTIEYDGTAYSGWQRQINGPSVQQTLEEALARLTGETIGVVGSSRTDAGVHACGLCAHFDSATRIPPEKICFALNTMLPPDVRVTAARVVPEWLHARFSCRGKIYTYRIHNARHASAIRRNWTTHIPVPVDEGKILIDGVDVTKLGEHQRAAYIGRVFQDPMTGTAATMQIEENLALAARRGKRRGLRIGITKAERERYRELLKSLDLGLEDRLTARVGLLSGGQRQALTLLMATMNKPKLLLLDEHTAALDPKTALKVLTLSAKIVEENHLTTMMITHNMKDAIKYGNRLIMMHEGHIIYDVSGEEKKNLHVSDLLAKFQIASGGEFANDRMILS